jgi:hypothetical protein
MNEAECIIQRLNRDDPTFCSVAAMEPTGSGHLDFGATGYTQRLVNGYCLNPVSMPRSWLVP